MATNIKIVLDTRYRRKDSTFPLIMRLIRDRKSITIPLGIYISETEWNAEKEQIRRKSRVASDATRLNNLIQKKRTEAYDIITKLTDSGRIATMELKEIKQHIQDRKSIPTFFRYTEKIMEELLKADRIGTARNYKAILSSMKKFRNGKDFELREINYTFLKKFENHYYGLGNSTNGLASALKNLRAVCNRAIKEKLMPRDWYPFEEYVIRRVPTKNRALEKRTVCEIEQLELKSGTNLWLSQQAFLFSFYVAGINFADIARLKHADIKGGRLEYIRRKTTKPHSVKLTAKAMGIINNLEDDKSGSPYIFPVLKDGDTAMECYIKARSFVGIVNRELKTIGEMVGTEIPLTTYVARHTYATEAKRLGISTEVISELLNHEDLKTTQTYLASLENNVLDQANDLITG